jgi:uncharacterized protein
MDRDEMAIGLATLITPMISALVDDPSAVKVDVSPTNTGTMFISIAVKKEEVGKVIGREGRTANAIRTLVSAFCAKYQFRSHVEIVD